jgi:Protein of unknown function (DUF4238)
MAKLRRPHVVPAGYQRNFAEGERIRMIDKTTLQERVVGVRDNFVASHFLRVFINGEPTDEAEDSFAQIEASILPLIKTLTPFESRPPDAADALKASMAMLWSRSFAHQIVSERVHLQAVHEMRQFAAQDALRIQAFERERGRKPEPGDMEAVVDEVAAKLKRDRLHDVNAIHHHHNNAVEKFDPLYVSLYRPIRGCEFVTSDNPVLLARSFELVQVGAQNGLALGDASFIFLPISRFVGACLTLKDEGDLELDRLVMIRINQAMWRNAVARVACHPSLENWRAACNIRRQAP